MTEPVSITGARELNRRLANISDGQRLLLRLQTETVREAKRLVPRKTGNLGRSIAPGYLTSRDALVVARAGYALFVEQGTGVYGPTHRPITPKRAKVLAWRTGAVTLSGASRHAGGQELAGWAFAKSVKGRKATPFLLPGAQKAVSGAAVKGIVIDLWNAGA